MASQLAEAPNYAMLTIADAAEYLGVSTKFIRREIWQHRLEARRVGRAIRIPLLSIIAYADRLPAA